MLTHDSCSDPRLAFPEELEARGARSAATPRGSRAHTAAAAARRARGRRGHKRQRRSVGGQWGSSVVGGGGATLPPGFADMVQHTFKLVLAEANAAREQSTKAEQRVQNIEKQLELISRAIGGDTSAGAPPGGSCV